VAAEYWCARSAETRVRLSHICRQMGDNVVLFLEKRWPMKFITVRDLRTTPAQIWKALPEEQEIVITNNGKPIALLTPLTDTDLEDTLASVRRARAINAVNKMQAGAVAEGISGMTMEEIDQEIRAYRKSKKT
jgi:antitoxin (DNA-binding transcriptional repressor) of toxin-antitoxin stability system